MRGFRFCVLFLGTKRKLSNRLEELLHTLNPKWLGLAELFLLLARLTWVECR